MGFRKKPKSFRSRKTQQKPSFGVVLAYFSTLAQRSELASKEINYSLHLFIRLAHDKLYSRNRGYKKWSDKSYSEAVHKATLTGFIASFLVFGFLQYAVPNMFDLLKSNEALAGSNSKTWTTNGDFNTNAATTGIATTKSNVAISGATAGDDAVTTLSSPEPNFDTLSISSGPNFTLAVKTDGTLWSWGWNGAGQLGQGTTDSNMTHNTPVQVGSGTNWKMVSAGGNHSVAIKTDGTIWAWGYNYSGQLGISSNVSQNVPTKIGVGTTWKYVTAGGEHTIALKNDGTIWSWGYNNYGQLGLGTTDTATTHNSPVKIGTGTTWKMISTRDYHNLAVKTDGTLWSWGRNNYGQLGQGTSDSATTHNAPVQAGVGNTWKIISAGGQFSLALKTDGTLWSWGFNDLGRLGQGTSDGATTHNVPTQIGSGTTWRVVMAGLQHSLATKSDGTLWAWGYNGSGQLGSGDTSQKNAPYQVGIGTSWKMISISDYSSFAVKMDGTFWSCGHNAYGNLGQGMTDSVAHNLLVQVGIATNWLGVIVAYPTPGTLTGLKIDAGSGNKYKWTTLVSVGSTPANTSIVYLTRGSEDNAAWTSLAPLSGTSIQTAPSRYLEVQVSLTTSDPTATPTLNDFTVTYDSLEAPVNTSLTLKRTDNNALKNSAGGDVSAGIAGAWSNSTVRVEASGLTCTDCGITATNLRPEVEAKPVGTAFTGTGTVAAVSGNSYADISGLIGGTTYHLQVRAIDDQGRASAWTPYGNNAENVADVSIDQTVPTGSFSINSGAQFATSTTVNLNNTAIDTGGSNISQMRFSNDNTTWSAWETYSAVKVWTLASGDGDKTVYAQYQDNAGNVDGGIVTALFSHAAPGTYSDIVPVGTTRIYVDLKGAGGGGGATYNSGGGNGGLSSFRVASGFAYIANGGIGGTDGYDDDIIPNSGEPGTTTAGSLSGVTGGALNGGAGGCSDVCGWDGGPGGRVYGYLDVTSGQSLTLVLGAGGPGGLYGSYSENGRDGGNGSVSISKVLPYTAVVTLDTASPSNLTGLSMYENSTKSNPLTDNSKWYTYTAPYFEWTASGAADLKEYRYCFDASATCTPATVVGLATTYTANLSATSDSAKYFRVVAVDNAGNASQPVTLNYNFDKTLPGEVTGFSASSNDLSKITLSWNAFIPGQGAPLENYKLERVKYSAYQFGLWDQSSNWSAGDGYANFILTNAGFMDDSVAPQQGQVAIETSVKYIYRISVKDQSNTQYSTQITATGLTRDGRAPEDITGVKAGACDGTLGTVSGTSLPKCSNIANKGFETALYWNVTVDVGTGVDKYFIYRATSAPDVLNSFSKVAEVPAVTNIYYDNDASSLAPESRLNDYSTYYYRVTAVDVAGNESSILPVLDPTQNTASATTPDVTRPSTPEDVVVTPMGLDGSDPNGPGGHQRVQLTWSASLDTKARSAAAGSGIFGYKVYRADAEGGPYVDVTNDANLDCDMGARICTNDNMTGFTYYYYQVEAMDMATPTANVSAPSTPMGVRTASDDVPGVPTHVTVSSTKGDAMTDVKVGRIVSTSFVGSSAKNYQIVKYQVFRSVTNYALAADWLNPAKATQLKLTVDPTCGSRCFVTGSTGGDIDIPPTQDDRNSTYTINDAGVTDATGYFYKVRAMDNTPEVPSPGIGGPYFSGLSAVTAGIPGAGWDITPDATSPTLPAGGLEVKVRDTHPNEVELRNIVTWKVLTNTTAPRRNGSIDFAKYLVRRETYNPITNVLISDDIVSQESDMSVNYFTDVIGIAFADLKYKYYIQIVDNAGTDYKYTDGSVINAHSNYSVREYSPDSIIPAKAKPVLTSAVVVSNVSVASAEVSWTTDQDSDSIVQFRPAGSTGEWMIDGTIGRTTSHDVKIVNLAPNTHYEYQIISRNYLGNNIENVGTLPELTTSGFNITPGNITSTTSTTEISWTTNLDASSAFVEYQLQRKDSDEAQGGTAGVDTDVLKANPKNHHVVIKGLRSARTYTYKIKSISKDGYLSEYPGGEFATFTTRTFDSAQFTLTPSSSNVAERNITATTAQIVWQTENDTTSWVDYSTTSGVYDNAAGNNDLVATHVVVIEGLVPGTTYFYRVRVKDANEVEYTSQEYSFTAVLKPKISNMTVKDVTPYSVTVAWDTNVDTETIVNWGKTAAYGEKRGKSGVSKVHEIVIDKLDDNQEYHYQILATDDAGNEVADTDKIVRTPLDTEGPKITGVKIDVLPMGESDTTSSIIVSWQTNKPASTLVEYGEGVIGGTYDKRSVEDTTLNNSHTVIIKGLTPASSYHYRLVSADKRSNKTISQDYTFVTPSKEKSILQLIIKSLEETFAWTRNLNQFFGNIGRRLSGN